MRLRMLVLTSAVSAVALLPAAAGLGAGTPVKVDIRGEGNDDQTLHVKGSWTAVPNVKAYKLANPSGTAVFMDGTHTVTLRLRGGTLVFVGSHVEYSVHADVTASTNPKCKKGAEALLFWGARAGKAFGSVALSCRSTHGANSFNVEFGKHASIVKGKATTPAKPTPKLPDVFKVTVNGVTATQHINGDSTGPGVAYVTMDVHEGADLTITATLDQPLPATGGWYAYTERTGDPESPGNGVYFHPCTVDPGEMDCAATRKSGGRTAGQQETVSFQVGRTGGGRNASVTITWIK